MSVSRLVGVGLVLGLSFGCGDRRGDAVTPPGDAAPADGSFSDDGGTGRDSATPDAARADGGVVEFDAGPPPPPGCSGGATHLPDLFCNLDLAVADGPGGTSLWVKGAVDGFPHDGCASVDGIDLVEEDGTLVQRLEPAIDASREVFGWRPAGAPPAGAITDLCEGIEGRWTTWEARVRGSTATQTFDARCGGSGVSRAARISVVCNDGVDVPPLFELTEQPSPDIGLELRAQFDVAASPVSWIETDVFFFTPTAEMRTTPDWVNDPLSVFPLLRVLPIFVSNPLGDDWCPHIEMLVNPPELMTRVRGQLEDGTMFSVEGDVGSCQRTFL